MLNNHYKLMDLLRHITRAYDYPIVLFTRFEINEVPNMIKRYCNYIKTGMYLPECKGEVVSHGITLQTTNQKVWKKENDNAWN